MSQKHVYNPYPISSKRKVGITIFHIALHFIVPAIIACVFFPKQRKLAYLILIATMAVDIDHLLADPIYDPTRCSIGFHPLHRLPMVLLYGLLWFWPKARIPATGLLIHMALDSIDCQVTNGFWYQP